MSHVGQPPAASAAAPALVPNAEEIDLDAAAEDAASNPEEIDLDAELAEDDPDLGNENPEEIDLE